MDVYWVWAMKAVMGIGVLCILGLIVAGVMTSRGNEDNMIDDGQNPIRGTPLWFVVKLGCGSLLALALCLLMLLGYVWMISDGVDEDVNRMLEQEQMEREHERVWRKRQGK